MKKLITVVSMSLLLTGIIYGQNIQTAKGIIEVETKNVSNSTLVKLTDLSKAIDLKTSWNKVTKEVTVTDGQNILKISIANGGALYNGIPKETPVKATIIDGSTYIPLRFIAEVFKYDIKYENSMIYIGEKSSTQMVTDEEFQELLQRIRDMRNGDLTKDLSTEVDKILEQYGDRLTLDQKSDLSIEGFPKSSMY